MGLGWGYLTLAQPRDFALGDEQTANFIYPLAGVNYMTTLDK